MNIIKYFITIAAAIAAAIAVYAQPNCSLRPEQTVLLYPEGQARGKGLPEAQGPIISNGYTAEMENISIYGDISCIGDKARMELYFPEKPNGQMVIVCPGGGYGFTSSWNEGVYVADWMLERGITVCVVEYRMPEGHWEIPLQDIQNAFRYCRAHAPEWNVNQIGVMGFSAGGHLAASTTNLYTDEVTRPDFSILIYPVISMEKGVTHMGTRRNLIGKDEKWADNEEALAELEKRYSIELHVSGNTPASFIVHCTDDTVVPVENSLRYYRALVQNGVPAELHIFPKGRHGWGFSSEKFKGKGRDGFAYARNEFEASLSRWLESLRK